jgi:hypothetical protein
MKKIVLFINILLFVAGITRAQPPAIITANGPVQFCQGGTVLLTANSGTGYSYQWKESGANISGATGISYTATINGNYRCVVTDGTGSSTSNMIAVTVFPLPTPNLGPDATICQGNSTVLNGGSGFTCYMWSNGETTQTISVNTSGTYVVTVCDNNGCTGSDAATITVNPNPAPVITGTTSFCQGTSGVLNAGAGYACYQWSPGAITQSININTAGVYTVTVCDANGCTGTASAAVTVSPLPTAALSGTSTICLGSSTAITIAFTGSVPFTYSYTDGVSVSGPLTTNSNPVIINVSPTVTTVYTLVSVADANCTGVVMGNATVTVVTLPTAIISGNQSICQGGIVNLSINFTGVPPFVYSYTDGTTTFGPFTTGTNNVTVQVSPSATTTYTVTSVSDANCFGTTIGSATVTVNSPNVSITANGPLSFCQGDSVLLTCNAGLSSYQWKRFNVPIAGATSLSYWVKTHGNYRCVGTDASACTGTSNMIHVSVPCMPVDPPDLKTSYDAKGETINKSYLVSEHLQLNVPVKNYLLFDSRGLLIEKKSIENNMNFFDIDLTIRKSGIYFLELFLNDPVNSTVKIKVLKL